MFIFFVNRPWTVIPFILGLSSILMYTLEDRSFPLNFIFTGIFFYFFYTLFLIRYYLLSCPESKIFGLPIKKFRIAFDIALLIEIIGIYVSVMGASYMHEHPILTPSIMLASFISPIILGSIIQAKLVTEALKINKNLKDIKFEEVYDEFRQIILKRLIRK